MYKPMWTQFEQIPGRCVNMARVHHDMLEKVPTIKKAKIRGYPSVIKVEPSGAISEYVIPETGEKTNAVPFMREQEKMKELLTTPPPMNSGVPGTQEGIRNVEETLKKEAQIGGFVEGSVLGSLASAVQAVGPTALLLFANTLLPKGARSTKTYKSPKRSSRRASTRRNRSNA
jgi:hypothetical protein